MAAASVTTGSQWRPASNPWLIAVSVMLATFMEVLDTSIASVALPYIAVVYANGGREPDNTRGFMEYRPNVPATRDPRTLPEASEGNGTRPVEPGSADN